MITNKSKHPPHRIVSVLMAASLLLAACGGDDADTSTGGSPAATESSADAPEDSVADTDAADATSAPTGSDDARTGSVAGEDYEVAVLLYSQGFEFMVALGQGIEQEAERLGVEVTLLDAKGDSSAQISQIQDQLAQGVDGFILSPNNSDELVPGVQMIIDAGLPVVTVDSIVTGDIATAAVAYNNEAAGMMGAETLAELMGTSGTALEFEGAKGAYHATLRGGGFKEGMKAFPDISVTSRDAEWTADNALAITVDTFTVDPDINGLFSHNDEMVRGIVSGLKQIDKAAKVGEEGHIPLVGVDGTPLALERIRNGTQDATVNQDPYVMGALALETVVKILNGQEVEKLQLTEPSLITKENVDDPELWGNVFGS